MDHDNDDITVIHTKRILTKRKLCEENPQPLFVHVILSKE